MQRSLCAAFTLPFAFVGVLMAQAQSIQIDLSPPDVAASGVWLVPTIEPGHTADLKAILASDSELLSPLLPYSVLLVNGSQRKLRAMGLIFRWQTKEGPPAARLLVLTAMSGPDDPTRLAPGGVQLFTPAQEVNQFAAVRPDKRKLFLGQAQLTGSNVVQQPPSDFPAIVRHEASDMATITNLRVAIEGIVFDDYSYAGTDRLLDTLQQGGNPVHR